MRQHLFRINGIWYYRWAFNQGLIDSLATHQHREIRLSLFTTNHVYARELAKAYWLACRELANSDLRALGICSIDDFKSHIRRSVMTHLPQQYIPLFELTGSTEEKYLVEAIRALSAFHVDFFVMSSPNLKGSIIHKYQPPSQRWPHGAYEAVSTANGQVFPPLQVPTSLINNTVLNEVTDMLPDKLYYTVKDEKFCLMPREGFTIHLHQLFVQSDLPQHILATVRKIADKGGEITSTAPKIIIPSSKLLSKEIENYCAHKKNKWKEKSGDEFKMHLQVFVDIVGDKELLQLTDADCDRYIQQLPRLPTRRTQNPLYRGKTTRELLAMSDQPEVLSPKTVETYYTTVRSFIQWASLRQENKGMNTSILHMAPETRERKGDGWQAFTDEQLTLLFESEKSLTFIADSKHPYQRWITPIGLHTGARLGEICALRVKDFGTDGDIPYMELNDNEDETREGKSSNSVRRIPIHKTLLDLGIMQFVEHKKNDPSNENQRLFPECSWVNKHGYRKAASRWFGMYLDHLGITGKQYVFHSFRHNVSDPLTTKDELKEWRISRYFGHALPSDTPESVKSYFKQKKVEHLLPVIEAINYNINWKAYSELCRQTFK